MVGIRRQAASGVADPAVVRGGFGAPVYHERSTSTYTRAPRFHPTSRTLSLHVTTPSIAYNYRAREKAWKILFLEVSVASERSMPSGESWIRGWLLGGSWAVPCSRATWGVVNAVIVGEYFFFLSMCREHVITVCERIVRF